MPTRITRERLDEFLFGLRGSGKREHLDDVSQWSTDDEAILGVLFYVEKADSFLGMVFRRDEHRRYQPFGTAVPFRTKREGDYAIQSHLSEFESGNVSVPPIESEHKPGLDLFSVTHNGKLSPVFENVKDGEHSQAARRQLEEIAHWFIDGDGNFVRDFQTTGTDARLWELYLYRTFRALDFAVDQSVAIPDFSLSRDELKIFVEAVTANPSSGKAADLMAGPTPRPENFWHFIENDMPIIFGSPLFSKLKKAYWEREPVKGHPFALAIADFHAPGSMIWSHTALSTYLYGTGVERIMGPDGREVAIPKPISSHYRGRKTIPSNFFAQPHAENISAVIFSNAATKAKFTRMGTLAGFGNPAAAVRRSGTLSNPMPGALDGIPFDVNIENGDYKEHWFDELEIYHNPNALHPWPDETVIPEATHFKDEDGELVWRGEPFRVLNSYTQVQMRPAFADVEKTDNIIYDK